jgi:hypothetical protein
VRALGVAGAGEGAGLGLESREGGGLGVLRGEPVPVGLLEPSGLALGLGVVGLAVFLGDAEAAQLVLEGVAAAFAAGQAGGEHHPVVGQGRGWGAVAGDGGAEGGQHDRAGHAVPGSEGQGVPGVAIEPGQHLGAGPVGERVMGEAGLPALVGLLGSEPDAGRLRPLARLGDDQAAGCQVPGDGRCRYPGLVMMLQVPGDGVRAGVQTLPGQVLAQPDDQVNGLGTDRLR